jgi:RNA polymerase sigma factor (sigma-70 family)
MSGMDEHGDDFGLLEAWRRGDARAGDLLAQRHYRAILRFFEAKIPAVADDLTQRTFLTCTEALDRTHVHTSFRAFLFGIARNHMLRHLRSRERHDRRFDFEESPSRMPLVQTSATGLFARKEEHHFLLRALVELPVDLQIAVQLRYWDDLASSEIAAVLDVPASTVRTRLARARELLLEQLVKLQLPPAVHSSLVGDLDRWARSLAHPEPDVPVQRRV